MKKAYMTPVPGGFLLVTTCYASGFGAKSTLAYGAFFFFFFKYGTLLKGAFIGKTEARD